MNIPPIVLQICLVSLTASLAFVLYRVFKGPHRQDRIASLDLASVIIICTIGVLSIEFKNAAFLDVAVILAIIVFLGTVAFSRYLERSALNHD
ncbi:hypothetical protein C0431_08485 [bacterium]|nr:hypothetical protein [bacterium]